MQGAFCHIGFTAQATIQLDQGQGISTIAELLEFDDDEISSTCRSIRGPGTMIPNPAITPAATPEIANAIQPHEVQAPGVGITHCAEINFKLAAYWCHYHVNTAHETFANPLRTYQLWISQY